MLRQKLLILKNEIYARQPLALAFVTGIVSGSC